MNRYFWLTLITLSLLTIASSQDAKRLIVLLETTEDKLLESEGETVRVKGLVSSTNKNSTGIHFLNFEGSKFQCVTFARYVKNFEQPPSELYKNKSIEITGEIQKYRGLPQIRLTEPQQVRVLKTPAPAKVVKTPKVVDKEPKEEEPLTIEPVVKPQPKKDEPVLEVIDGVPAIDWRLFFPRGNPK